MKGGPKLSLMPFLHRALQLLPLLNNKSFFYLSFMLEFTQSRYACPFDLLHPSDAQHLNFCIPNYFFA